MSHEEIMSDLQSPKQNENLDLVNVVRCKDCMHNGSFDTDCPIDWNGKEYCSFAERKEDE